MKYTSRQVIYLSERLKAQIDILRGPEPFSTFVSKVLASFVATERQGISVAMPTQAAPTESPYVRAFTSEEGERLQQASVRSQDDDVSD
jgi:hypothetical protein